MNVNEELDLNIIFEQVEKYCSFSLGKKLIRDTVPSFEKLVIKRDHERIKEALACTVKYGAMPVHGISDITSILTNAMKDRILSAGDCLDEIRFISGIREMISYERSLEEIEHPYLSDLCGTLTVHTKTEIFLSRCFNEYGEIKDSASPQLKGIRSALRNADASISSAAQKFVGAHASSVVDSIITYRGGRAVVLIKASDKNIYGGYVYGDSASHQASYVEPSSFVPLNNRRLQLLEEEKEEIQKILHACTKEIASIADEELGNVHTAAILDALFAKALWGKERNGCAAELSDGDLSIVHARHPLIDPENVVENTYHITSPKRVLLITGPNTGGKTVSMKIIGLFTLMTYSGMPVTAESASIPFFDRVFADIGDDQSVISSLSSFSAHMTRQSEIMHEATRNSLVLLDEIGAGTDPREGESLAIAILNELRERGTMCVVTTHFERLKAYGKRHDDIMTASVQFDLEKLAPTYRYIEGLTGQSNAFEVAQRYGLPDSIVKYARNLKNQAKTQEDELIEKLEKQLNDAEIKQEKLDKLLKDNDLIARQLHKEEKQIADEKETYRDKAKLEADAYVDSTRRKAKAILKNIQEREKNVKYHEALEAVKELNVLDQSQEEQDALPLPENYQYHIGDAVELNGNQQVCEVVSINRNRLTILMNGRKIEVKKNQIHPSVHVIPRMKKQNHVSIDTGRDIFAQISPEVNLIGLHVDEAMEKMDSYMDTAALQGMKNFRIIHGDGSGKLRKAVHERLKLNPSVKEFRLGIPQEGGTGATIVTMK